LRITEEVEDDIVIQEDASEFDAEVEVEKIDEIYVSDEEPPADTSSVEVISHYSCFQLFFCRATWFNELSIYIFQIHSM
jgi:hypothetical protein